MQKFLTRAVSALAVGLVFSACQEATEPVALEASAGSGSNTKCQGVPTSDEFPFPEPLTGTFDNIVVPRGQACFLLGSTVRGNVKALKDSRLLMVEDVVGGNVEGDKASLVQVFESTVHGNIHIIEGHDLDFTSAFVAATALPNGNIQIEKGRHPFGDFVVAENTLDKGNIKVEENSSEFESFIVVNTVAQDVQVFKNTQVNTVVADNVIGENLQCKENSEPFVGEPNAVGGDAEDQCAGSGAPSASVSERVRPDLSEFPRRKRTE